MINLIAFSATAFNCFVKGQEFIYITNAVDSKGVGKGEVCLKIGKTTNVKERLRAYLSVQTEGHFELFPVENGAIAEKLVHKALAAYHLKREMFSVEALDEARELLKALSE